jgi:hypothetical protein
MSRFTTLVLSLCSVILVAGSLASCRSLARFAADKVYPDLPTYSDTEAPPTAMPFPASSSITAVIGGRGEGLSCSIPSLLETAMFDRAPNDASISLQFRQGCVYHDYCYRHGHATYGYTRNDCDYALQKMAYRTCRVISNRDPDDCMSRARRVLLGVTLGGGKAFSAYAESTYFEFDPMPEKADDYVVVRWVRSAAGAAIGDQALNGEFLVMHYKRGTVSRRTAGFDPAGPNPELGEALAFPGRYIATPPFVLRDANEDRLRAVARDNFQDTRIEVVEYWPASAGQRRHDIAVLDKDYRFDPDASVFWFGTGRWDELSFWSYTAGFGTANRNQTIRAPAKMHDYYRTLQHAPLEGNFFAAGCTMTAVLKRGGPQASTDDDDGAGFDANLHLHFVRSASPPCTPHAPVTLAASQAHEPLAVVRLDAGRDALLGTQADGAGMHLSLFDLARATGTTPLAPAAVGLPAPFDATWLAMPPQIVADTASHSSLLFFSRYVPWDGESGKGPLFEFRYLRLGRASDGTPQMRLEGSGSCRIDLARQLAAVRPAQLGKNIARPFRPDEKKPDPLVEEKIASAIRRDLNERWANAQIIPGWFVRRAGAHETGPLDVAVFFRGYSQYAFLAKGEDKTGPADTAHFKTVAPAYVACS